MQISTSPRFAPAVGAVFLALLMATGALAQTPIPLPSKINVETPYVSVSTAYAEDFETGNGSFVAGGDLAWEYGEPTVHVVPETGQGANMWGTELDGEYTSRLCATLTSPGIDLSGYVPGVGGGVTTGRLLFRHWYHLENRWDGGVVQASTNGVDWSVLTPKGGYDTSMISSVVRGCLGVQSGEPVYTGPSSTSPPAGDQWKDAEFDVSTYLGGPLFLRFVMSSDSSRVRLGWYVDDLRIEVGAGVRTHVVVPQVDPVHGVPFTPLSTLYAEDFELDGGGWTVAGTGTWQWGEAVAPPVPPTGGLNVWGTALDGPYGPSACATLTSPPIALPGAAGVPSELARMQLQLWHHTRSGYDAAVMEVSTDDGGNWSRIVPQEGYDRTITVTTAQSVRDCLGVGTTDRVWSGPFSAPREDEWSNVTVDLTPYLGSEVRVRFVFGSTDEPTDRRGVYIDDVVVQLGASAVTDPDNPLDPLQFTHPAWTVSGVTSWAYGVPTTGPFSGSPVWATDLHGDYGSSECGAITSPAVDTTLVPGLGHLRLTMEHFFDSASTADAGIVQASKDNGKTWVTIVPEDGYGGTIATSARACLTGGPSSPGYVNNPTGNAYEAESFDIRGFDSTTFRVRFVFTSSTSSEDPGWYVRNVAVTRSLAPVPLSDSNADLWDVLGEVADEPLLSRLKADPLAPQRAVLLGPDTGDLTHLQAVSRKQAMVEVAARAAPFFDAIDEAAKLSDGAVTHRHAAGPAVSVVGDALFLARLAEAGDARAAAYDGEDAVHLVAPLPSEEDDLSVQNTGGRQLIQAEDIWALGYRGEGIKIAVIDTGIDPGHEAFKRADGSSRIVNFTDFVGGASTPYDDHGHGTHVAATAAGSDEYLDPVHGRFEEKGVAPKAEIYVAKFLNGGGSGHPTNGMLSLQWAFDEGADITSNSWGSSCTSSTSAMIEVISDLTDLGMVSVFAAGNSGPSSRTIGGPACGEAPISVGAVDQNKVIAWFSSRGPCSDPYLGTPERICPDVVAKGVQVRSAIPRSGASWSDPSGYRTWDGTSMATPHVAGAAALSEQMKRDVTGVGWDTAARAEEEVFKLTAEDLGAVGPDNNYGDGLVQLLNVHQLIASTDEANVISSFDVSRNLLHQGESTTLTFGVRNLGGAEASGTFKATLTDPFGSVVVLEETPVTLALLDRHGFSHTFTVGSNVLHGNYTFRGVYEYTWTNGTTGAVVHEVIEHEGVFEVKRVYFDLAIDGYPASAAPLVPQALSVSATNVGNEGGSNVRYEFTVPDSYLFVPGENFDPTDLDSQYANPAPDDVHVDNTFGRVTLIWNRPTANVGETFEFTTNLAPTELGTMRALFVVKYNDGIGSAFSQGAAATQVVALPVP